MYNTTLYTEDDTKSASQLAAQIKAERRGPVLALTLDVAAVSLYSVAISAIVQAVVAEAGPCTGQQKFGHIIPTLPPVANWTKGCSLAGGPKVGIPLTVHGAALPVQQMAASSSSSSSSSGGGVGGGGNSSLLQFAASAVSARILGTASSQTTRLACPFRIQPGNTEIAPRVGLIQPVPPRQYVHGRSGSNMEEDLPVLYVTGQCTVVQALSEYLLHQGPGSDMDETVNEESDEYGMSAADDYDCGMLSGSLESSTQNWSTAWTEQQAVTFSVLPFFLALTPPIVERNITHAKKSPSAPVQGTPHPLLLASWKHLYTLYSENGIYAATLIRLLAALIRTGGARVHEEVLQNGILHVLASSLRLGLIRAIKHKLYTATSMAEFLSLAGKLDESPSSSSSSASPSYIPLSIAEAVAQLLDVCCGPPSTTIEELSPAMQIRRTSDVALTALFGLALDFDLWGGDLHAAAIVLTAVSSRYGGTGGCITTGYVLRSQIAVQHFLDQIRLLLRIESVLPTSNNKYDGTPIGETGRSTIAVSKQQALETVALSLSQLLQSILLSSLSNHRSIVQAEMDISACVAALTDCPLGTVTAHVILTAIVGVLTWCEILPAEAASSFLPKCHSKISITVSTNEEHKVEVASRLGRNLLVAQFHDVVAPVLLSRTVFSGDKTLASLSSQKSILPNLANVNGSSSLSWQKHWQLSLLLFSWVASIAGPEGVIASKSTGSLVLASAFAGSLEGALENSNKVVTVTLFMPSPAMALLIGATLRNEWSYKDLIADRLQIMIPMLPGMLVSLLSHPSDAISDKLMTRKALTTISDILTAVVGAFHRVFGGVSHGPSLQSAKKRGEGSSDEIKAARAYVPHLLVVAMILENHIAVRSPLSNKNGVIPIMRVPSHDDDNEMIDKVTQPDSWVDVAISSSTDLVGEIIVSAPEEHDLDISTLVAFLRSCQISVISTACGLIANSMSLGGAGAAIPLWTAILATLQESKCYAATDATKPRGPDPGAVSRDSISIPLITDSMKSSDLTQSWANEIAQNVLCRVISLVLLKSLKREQHWDAWEYELSSAIAKLFTLVEEKELLTKPAQVADNGTRSFSGEQIVLICSFLGVLAYGRQASGWCQLPLPPMDQSGDKTSGRSFGDLTAQSTLLLPVLRPCLRIVLQCLKFVDGETNVLMPTSSKRENEPQQLLGQIIPELNQTLTAAIVGLSFSTARDTALHAMTTFRRCHAKFKDTGDGISAEVCGSLFSKVAEELRVRYEIEQKMRKAAQVDAYNESGDKQSAREAARSSSAFERLIMGDVLLGDLGSSTEEITFNNDDVETNGTNVDFVIFPEMATTDQESKGMLGFTQVQGLHAALEECKSAPRKENETYTYVNEIAALSPFLDAWDEAAINDTQNVELVKLFETNFDINTGIHSYSMPILGSETAADAMSTFFEFAAVEKSRLQELLVRFLPGHRTSRRAFSDRFGWARYLELGPSDADRLFERTIPDGNRDVRSRLPTLPCSQQFRRYLPKYLDHGEDEIESTLIVDPISPISPEKDPSHRSSVGAIEMDAFTKSLLETGNLEIVDITKKEIDDEDDAGAIPSASGDLSDDEEDAGMYAETGPSLDQESDSTMNTMKKESTEINVTFSHEDETDDFTSDFVGKGHHNITTSSFSTPPDNSSSSLSLMHSAAAGMIEHHADNCTHVKPEGNRQCAVLLTSSHLIIEYDGNSDGFFEGEILAREEESDRQKRMAEDAVFSKEENPETQNQQADEKRQKETAGLRPKSIRWNLSEVSHIYLRR